MNIYPLHRIILYLYFVIILLIFLGISKYNVTLNLIVSILVSYGVIYYIISKDRYTQTHYNKKTDLKLTFLEDIIQTNSTIYISNYLHLNALIIQFYFDMRDYIEYNLSNYRDSLISVNSMLMLEEQSGKLENPGNAYRSIKDLYKEAMNHFQSIVHSIPYDKNVFDKFNKSLLILQSLLLSIVDNVKKKCQLINKLEITTDYIPDMMLANEVVVDANDTISSKYSNNFNFY